MNPDTKTQITAMIAFLALAIKFIFRIEVPPEIQDHITEVIGMVILVVLYFLRAGMKKLEK